MESKSIKFRKVGDKFELPNTPRHLVDEANKLYGYLGGPDNLITKLEAVHRYMNSFAPFVASFATCEKGCSHCCKNDVQITTFDAEYIYLKTGVPHTHEGDFTTGNRTPCPFLKDNGECGIYAMRPIICRTYHALGDPANCADPKMDQIQYGSEGSGFGNAIYKNLISWVHFQTAHMNGKLRDIRDFFPHPRAEVQSYLATRKT